MAFTYFFSATVENELTKSELKEMTEEIAECIRGIVIPRITVNLITPDSAWYKNHAPK